MGHQSNTRKHVVCAMLVLAIALCGIIVGLFIGKSESDSEDTVQLSSNVVADQQLLNLSVVSDSSSTAFSSEDINSRNGAKLYYFGVSNVTISIQGQQEKLELALYNNHISIEEITQQVRTDSRNGKCTEICISDLGLSRFFYSYPDFEVMLVYDMFETAYGDQQLINEIAICSYNYHATISPNMFHPEIVEPTSIFYEDWGLTLAIKEVSPQRISIICSHEGGQQIGELRVFSYSLWSDELGYISILANTSHLNTLPQDIPKNQSSTLEIDWTGQYGQLSSGEYQLLLYIEDNYDMSEVHPLNKNYTDKQIYKLSFEIK